MANDLNQCNFIGRLGRDPEVKYSADGSAIAGFSIAVGSTWKSKSGEKQESTEWVNVSAFGKLAEICGNYLTKGSQVYISGRMKTEKYTGRDGTEKYSTKIIADNMQMLGGKLESVSQQQQPIPESMPMAAKPQWHSADFDDGLPF